MVQTKEQYRLVYSTVATLFRTFLSEQEKSGILVEISGAGPKEGEEEDEENHQYENWKPSGQQQQSSAGQQQSSAGHRFFVEIMLPLTGVDRDLLAEET